MKKFKLPVVVLVFFLCLCGVMAGCNEPDVNEEEKAIPGLAAPYNITNNFAQDSSTGFLAQWHNDANVNKQKLQIVEENSDFKNAKTITVTGEPFETSGNLGSFAARNVFRAEATVLTPNTLYKYRMGDTGAWSETYYYMTSSGNADVFSFTVVSDPQSGTHSDMVKTLKAADAFDPDHRFYLMAGDIVNEITKNPTEIVSYTETANEFNKYRPIAATQGNHDTYGISGDNVYIWGESTVFNAFVTFPDNGSSCEPSINKSRSYYFYYNKVLFIVLNSMVTDDQHKTQKAWVEEILKNDRDSNLSKYKIVITHISPFGNRYNDGSGWKEPLMRSTYGKLFTDYGVDIVFAGHDHTYARSNRIKIGDNTTISSMDFTDTPDGTVYSVVGSTGPKFYDTTATGPSTYFPKRTTQEAEISPGMFVNVKVTAGKLIVTAKSLNGSTVDTYEVTAK